MRYAGPDYEAPPCWLQCCCCCCCWPTALEPAIAVAADQHGWIARSWGRGRLETSRLLSVNASARTLLALALVLYEYCMEREWSACSRACWSLRE